MCRQPPPTTSLTKVVPGLKQFANVTPSYGRQVVRTGTNGAALVSWIGRGNPVVYSYTVAEFPTAAGFYCGLTIAPGDPATQTYADPDWSAPTALWLNVAANGDGTQQVRFAYKTNQPSANGMLYGAGVLTNFTYNGSAVGTWKVTFTSDTDTTLTAPDGSTYSASIPADIAAMFAGPGGFWLMSCPANDANIGQSMTFSDLSITGTASAINQSFTPGVLSALLVLESQVYNWNTNPPNQFLLTAANGKYWNHWTLPDNGFSPVVKTNLASGEWQDLAYSAILVNGGARWALVSPSALPGASAGYFGLIKRTFSQLQILLPGQTNAPGTVLGYVGTPTPQSFSGSGTDITVNAVDSAFHIISGVSDIIKISTTPGGNFLPTDTAMVNGTATFTGGNNLLWGSEGTFTVTATDIAVTATNISPVVSAPVTVGP